MIEEDNIITTKAEYIRNGVAYTRVSSILKSFVPDGLLNWYKKTSKAKIEKVFKEACEIGSAVDKWTMDYADGEQEPYLDLDGDMLEAASKCVGGFLQYVADHNPTFNDWQVRRFDEELKVAGSRDFRINKHTILDIKTGTKVNDYPIKDSYWLQVSKYADMENKYGECEIENVAVVVFDKETGEYRYEERSFNNELVDVFDSMVKVYRYFNQ